MAFQHACPTYEQVLASDLRGQWVETVLGENLSLNAALMSAPPPPAVAEGTAGTGDQPEAEPPALELPELTAAKDEDTGSPDEDVNVP
eukprot:7778973-Alexandrium_andersonii.AAC.1